MLQISVIIMNNTIKSTQTMEEPHSLVFNRIRLFYNPTWWGVKFDNFKIIFSF